MCLRIFTEGPDRGTLLNVPEHLDRHPVPTSLEGEVLALGNRTARADRVRR